MIDLSKIIKNRKWVRCELPFSYVHAYDVFTDEVYNGLEEHFKDILRQGLHEKGTLNKFSRSIKGYDAYGVGFTEDLTGPLSIFTSLEWHDLMCNLFGVRGLDYVNAGLHYHKIGSGNGSIHNDYNPCWFPRKPAGLNERRITLPAHATCAYKNGAGLLHASEKVEVVRAVVMIYYLNNDTGWTDGDGGETGIFSPDDPCLDRPVCLVPPINNSVIIYECTPKSLHSFLSNKKYPRSSAIMWAHRSMEDAIAHWGDDLERWKDQ